jgi:hypothetical protein
MTFRARKLSQLLGGAASTGGQAIQSFTATGTKREGETVWLSITDDGSAGAYKFDVQANGVSLTGVSINDNGTITTTNFPFTTTHPTISFVVPAAVVGVPYTINGYAAVNAGALGAATAVQADEYFSFVSTFFTPAAIAAPTITRTSVSGNTTLVYRIDAPAVYDSYNIRQRRFNSGGVLQEENWVPVTENGLGTLSIDATSAADPQPYPAPLSALAAGDYVMVSLASADFNKDGGVTVNGVISGETQVVVTDGVTAMTWSTTDNGIPSGGIALTYSNGNLTVTDGTSGQSAVRANRAVAFTRAYWEVEGSPVPNSIGVADSTLTLNNNVGYGTSTDSLTPTTHAALYYQNNGGQLAYNNGPRGDVGVRDATNVGCIALDTRVGGAPIIYFGRVNKGTGVITWLGGGNPAAGTGGISCPGLSDFYPFVQFNNGNVATLVPGTTPGGTAGFYGSANIPAGYVAP